MIRNLTHNLEEEYYKNNEAVFSVCEICRMRKIREGAGRLRSMWPASSLRSEDPRAVSPHSGRRLSFLQRTPRSSPTDRLSSPCSPAALFPPCPLSSTSIGCPGVPWTRRACSRRRALAHAFIWTIFPYYLQGLVTSFLLDTWSARPSPGTPFIVASLRSPPQIPAPPPPPALPAIWQRGPVGSKPPLWAKNEGGTERR